MNKQNSIGLDLEKSKELADSLNDLLANYSIFYQNARGYHWNVKGDKFFELHTKFEELYNDLFVKIDDIAERILTLEHSPIFRVSNYLKISKILESNEENIDGTIKEILFSFQVLLTKQRKILSFSNDIADEGTSTLMSDYIAEQEKQVWMYTAYSSK